MSDNPVPPPSGMTGELKGALKAFRKMAGPLSSGKISNIVAITPPSQFRPEIWEELAKLGKLKSEGDGMYCLCEGA
jgi:hypothetical protein